jgi:hypothetical protein
VDGLAHAQFAERERDDAAQQCLLDEHRLAAARTGARLLAGPDQRAARRGA